VLIDSSDLSASMSRTYRSAATQRAIQIVLRVISGVTFGFPSRSPPIQDPKRSGAASSGNGSPKARSICRT
jgi:hypothetical protein